VDVHSVRNVLFSWIDKRIDRDTMDGLKRELKKAVAARGSGVVLIVVGGGTDFYEQVMRALGKDFGSSLYGLVEPDGRAWMDFDVKETILERGHWYRSTSVVVTNGFYPFAKEGGGGGGVSAVFGLGLPIVGYKLTQRLMDGWCTYLDALVTHSGRRRRNEVPVALYVESSCEPEVAGFFNWATGLDGVRNVLDINMPYSFKDIADCHTSGGNGRGRNTRQVYIERQPQPEPGRTRSLSPDDYRRTLRRRREQQGRSQERRSPVRSQLRGYSSHGGGRSRSPLNEPQIRRPFEGTVRGRNRVKFSIVGVRDFLFHQEGRKIMTKGCYGELAERVTDDQARRNRGSQGVAVIVSQRDSPR